MFKKVTENFTCEKCSKKVAGSGYTNHCPHCLWSKHVDIDPGDRKEECGGLMEPIGSEQSGGEWSIIQKCRKCGRIHKNKISPEDNFEEVINLSAKNL